MLESSFLQDYHLHTQFSIDGKMTMEAACDEALRRGIREVCFTEHVDFVPEDEGADFFAPEPYVAELRRCRELFRDRLVIRIGVEIGESHRFREQQRSLLSSYPFDFIIGSLHWVGDQGVMMPEYFDHQSRDEAYARYFTELLLLVQSGEFDVLGHLDVPKRYEPAPVSPFDSNRFADEIRIVLRACVERGVGIELNTGTMRRTDGDPSPSPEVLRWYRELGGEILTLGSDGHRTAHMAYEFERAMTMIRAAGFRHLTTFERRQPSFVSIG